MTRERYLVEVMVRLAEAAPVGSARRAALVAWCTRLFQAVSKQRYAASLETSNARVFAADWRLDEKAEGEKEKGLAVFRRPEEFAVARGRPFHGVPARFRTGVVLALGERPLGVDDPERDALHRAFSRSTHRM